jgi:ABC-type bacteriocin/lantibiotic exporter with double-glycine peptidase domain
VTGIERRSHVNKRTSEHGGARRSGLRAIAAASELAADRWALVGLGASAAVQVVVWTVQIVAFRAMIDAVVPSGNVTRLPMPGALIIGTLLIRAVLALRDRRVTTTLTSRWSGAIQRALFNKIACLPQSVFADPLRPAQLREAVLVDVALCRTEGGRLIRDVEAAAVGTCMGVAMLGLLVPYWSLLGIAAAAGVAFLAVTWVRRRRSRISSAGRAIAARDELVAAVTTPAGAASLRMLDLQRSLLARLEKLQAELVPVEAANQLIRDAPALILGPLSLVVAQILAALWAMLSLARGPYGLIMAATVAVGQMVYSAIALPDVLDAATRLLTAFGRIETVLELPEDVRGYDLMVTAGEIEVSEVDFAYDGSPILTDINFRVPGRARVAIVGASGSGKSTLVNLLAGLYRPTRGSIRIDGQEVSSATHASISGQVSVHPQDGAFFGGNIGETIRHGRPDATLEEAQAAAERAKIHLAIMRSQGGYRTPVQEAGTNLSPGMRVRVLLARTFLRASKVYIIDEPTGGLDRATAEAVMQEVFQHVGSATLVLVTHDLSLVDQLDWVIVLEQGVVVEQGKPDELLRRHGSRWAEMRRRVGGAPTGS